MKIVFFATPDFAIPSLKILHENNYDIAAVVTAPDKPKGRGRKFSPSPIKQFAMENNLKIFTPSDLNDDQFRRDLIDLQPDLFIVVAFRILPEQIFTIPKKGAFNLHGSLLPKYRGAAPIQWAIINGDTKTGLTTFFLKKKVDTGNIILSTEIDIDETDNFGSLHDKMSEKGAKLVLDTVKLIQKGDYVLEEQDNEKASPAPKIKKETCLINWEKSADQVHNLVRGLSPYPGAYFEHDNKTYKVYSTQITNSNSLDPAEIKESKNEIIVGTSTFDIKILEIQPEGRKRMNTEDFLRGYSILNP